MSLINDALKRTQQTTQGNEPPRLDDLELRPIEPGHTSPSTEGGGAKRIIWIVVLAVVTLNIALWIVFKDRGNETEVAARTMEVEPVEPVEATPEPVMVEPEAVAPGRPGAISEVSGTPLESRAELEPVAPQPILVEQPEFHLKTILAHPVHPSAMINNRVLFVGDRVQGYTVVAIDQHEVTLALDGSEVVVSLP